MKALLVYDSQFGNTEKIAQAIGSAFQAQVETTLIRAAVNVGQAAVIDLGLREGVARGQGGPIEAQLAAVGRIGQRVSQFGRAVVAVGRQQQRRIDDQRVT